MGTNYYLRYNECKTCGRYDEVHIGKSAYGWTFSFHATDKIRSWKQWQEELKKGRIFDEYGREHTAKSFIAIVESKKAEPNNHVKACNGDSFLDEEGNSMSPYEFS